MQHWGLTDLLHWTNFLKSCRHGLYLSLDTDLLVVGGAHLVVDELLVLLADRPHQVEAVLLRHDAQSVAGGLAFTGLQCNNF